jgi:ferritin-like metal-binding protein YciE
VGLFSKDIKTLEDLFLHGLRDIYYAEQRIVKSLPKMIENATDERLKSGFEQHLRETEKQVERLEKIFEMQSQEPRGTQCPGMDGILKEGDEIMQEVEDKEVLDIALVGAAQAVEHYEITRYGTLMAWAKELGRNDAVRILKQTLDEEIATDRKLSQMAEKRVNPRAESGGQGARRKSSSAKAKSAGSKSKRGTAGRKKAASARARNGRSAAKSAGKKKQAARRRA